MKVFSNYEKSPRKISYSPLPERGVHDGIWNLVHDERSVQDRLSYAGGIGSRDPLTLTNFVVESGLTNDLEQGVGSAPEDVIVVQWAASMFFAREAEKVSFAEIIRIGPLDRPCSVRFRTVDGSAKSGVKYESCSGVIEFAPGEEVRSIQVPIIEDTTFDTTLEFRTVLEDPHGCILAPHLSSCRTLILDNDLFPDNSFEKQIFHSDASKLEQSGVQLLISNLKFCFLRIPSIRSKSMTIAFLDQVQNLYYLGTIFLRIYLVDVVLNFRDPETEQHLWVQGNRPMTAIGVALLWTLPHLLLMVIGRLKVGPLFMELTIMTHYRVNLFRKYLNYKIDSREKVPIGDLVHAMSTDIKDVTNKGYLSVFQLLENLGKLCCVAVFICSKSPINALPLLVYPIVIFLVEYGRRTKQLRLETAVDEVQSRVRDVLVQLALRFQLISHYRRRQWVVDEYEKQLAEEIPVKSRLRIFQFWNNQIIPSLTLIALGFYIALGSVMVIHGHTTIGTFLATVNVYKDFGDRFEEMYVCLRTSLQAVEPLVGLVRMLNLQTNVADRMEANLDNLQYTKELLQEFARQGDSKPDHFDKMPIRLQGIEAPPHYHTTSADIAQASLTMVKGEHGSGKTTLMKIIGGLHKPKSGSVLLPAHLRCVTVEYLPELATDLNLYENLTFGDPDNQDPARVLRIVKRLGLSHDLLKILERNIADLWRSDGGSIKWSGALSHVHTIRDEDNSAKDEELAWYKRATAFDKKRVHLARSFIYNPEILVLMRPLDGLDLTQLKAAVSLFREFVDNRGIDLDPKTKWLRRPRTAIFTIGEASTEYASQNVDAVWHVDQKAGLKVTTGGRGKSTDSDQLLHESVRVTSGEQGQGITLGSNASLSQSSLDQT